MKFNLASTVSLALASAFVCAGGCAPLDRSSPQAVKTEADPFDPALTLRQWDTSVSYYANGNTVHQPTGFNYSPDTARPNWQFYVLDSAIFGLNVIILPYELVTNVPWNQSEMSQGVVLEPSHTAMPPLPASAVDVDEVTVQAPTVPATEPAAMPME